MRFGVVVKEWRIHGVVLPCEGWRGVIKSLCLNVMCHTPVLYSLSCDSEPRSPTDIRIESKSMCNDGETSMEGV